MATPEPPDGAEGRGVPGPDAPPRPARPPLSTTVKVVAAVVLGLTAFAVVFDRNRPKYGELLIQSDDARVRVAVREGGEVVVPWTDKRSITLRPGEYDVLLDADPRSYQAVPSTVQVSRGGRAVVHVRAVPGPPPRARGGPGQR